jgi:hypothetical protein
LRLAGLLRLDRLRSPVVGLSVSIGHGRRAGHRARGFLQRWWASRALDAVVWMLVLAAAIVVGLVIAWL